ncbi:MAG TPA: NUDIX domain-containing protein [Chitinophagaceae bacterium]|jgi:predicted NUDIX family NTP pyrophosphohydrolase|nr:NUDIX domain-containing protein [Chitinophagaceae bacterium]
MKKQSAGILAYRYNKKQPECCLVHPGGPFFKNKDLGAWSIPKGEFEEGEDKLVAAKREFKEEMGFAVNGKFIALDPVKLKSGKLVYAWAVEMDFDTSVISSNEFEIEWPPRSGRMQSFPEIDRASWFSLETAMEKINEGQRGLIIQLKNILGTEK